MANVEEVVVKFRAEGGKEVEASFHNIAEASKAVGSHVDRAGKSLDGLRAKSEGRIASNLGEIAKSMASGGGAADTFATAVTKLSESFRGSLLFAGAATVGLALYEGITKAGEAAISLDNQITGLRRDTSVSGDFIGSDKVNQNLTNSVALVAQLRERFTREHTGLGGEFNQALRGALELRTRGQLEAKDAEQIADARKSVVDSLGQQADKQFRLNDALREQLLGDQKAADLKAEEIEHAERLGQITAAAAIIGIQGTTEAEAAEHERHNLIVAGIEKRNRLEEKGIENAKDLAEVSKAGLTPQQTLIQSLNLELNYRKDILDSAGKGVELDRARLQYVQAQAQAQAQITAQIRSRGADVGTGSVNFQNQSIGRQIEEANARAEARAELGQLQFESRGRQLTPEEQARISSTRNIIGNEESERLEEERRALIRQQAQAQQILENNRGIPRNGGGIGPEGEREFDTRAQRLAEIDARLNQISSNRIRGTEPVPGTVQGDNQLRSDLQALIQALSLLPSKIGLN